MEAFSNEVKEKLKFYVYRLVDPRNGRTFYVGKGKGDRVFAHIKAKDVSSFYKENADEKDEDNSDISKIKMIMDIRNDGLEVIHIIQRWGLEEKEAFEIEQAFIDYFGLDRLGNKVNGHDAERGMSSANEIEKRLMAEPFEDYKGGSNGIPKFIILKITPQSIQDKGKDVYEAVKGNWKINPKKAQNYDYALAVERGIVKGVFKVDKWEKSDEEGRFYFKKSQDKVPDKTKKLFIDKKIPERYYNQNPVNYCDSKN